MRALLEANRVTSVSVDHVTWAVTGGVAVSAMATEATNKGVEASLGTTGEGAVDTLTETPAEVEVGTVHAGGYKNNPP